MFFVEVSTHIFGSNNGYKTLFCSRNVTKDEMKQLEHSLYFTETNDSTYVNSLKNKPAIIVRRLKSQRWALSRIFEGSSDEYCRKTFLVKTLLINKSDFEEALKFNAYSIVSSANWDSDLEFEKIKIKKNTLNYSLNSDEINTVLSIISSIELNASNSPVVVDSNASLKILSASHRLLPQSEKKTFSYSLRSLSENVPVKVLQSYKKENIRSNSSKHEFKTEYALTIASCLNNGFEVAAAYATKMKSFTIDTYDFKTVNTKSLVSSIKNTSIFIRISFVIIVVLVMIIAYSSIREHKSEKDKQLHEAFTSLEGQYNNLCNSIYDDNTIFLEINEKDVTQIANSINQLQNNIQDFGAEFSDSLNGTVFDDFNKLRNNISNIEDRVLPMFREITELNRHRDEQITQITQALKNCGNNFEYSNVIKIYQKPSTIQIQAFDLYEKYSKQQEPESLRRIIDQILPDTTKIVYSQQQRISDKIVGLLIEGFDNQIHYFVTKDTKYKANVIKSLTKPVHSRKSTKFQDTIQGVLKFYNEEINKFQDYKKKLTDLDFVLTAHKKRTIEILNECEEKIQYCETQKNVIKCFEIVYNIMNNALKPT
jgi:hypothetical protein